MKSQDPLDELQEYFLGKVNTILRPSSGYLKHPYLVPGGTYSDQLWDWDSFWIVKGLLAQNCDEESRTILIQHALGSWKNFFENQAENGALPILATPENPDVFNCRDSQIQNQAKPVMGQFALVIITACGEYEWIRPYFAGLLRFYQRWTEIYQTASGLLVWGSDVAIGVDNDPTTYCRPEFSSANLLLNCLFLEDLKASAGIADLLGETQIARELRDTAESITQAIQRECWDEIDGFFYSVDVQCKDMRDVYLKAIPQGMPTTWKTVPIKIKLFTGFLPMWCGIASPEQAQIMVERHLRNSTEFMCAGGIRTLACNERMYDPNTDTSNPSNWLGPVWILSNYLVYLALKNYGYNEDAIELASKTHALLLNDIKFTNSLHECYHPDTGVPNFNEGFFSWNILALLMK